MPHSIASAIPPSGWICLDSSGNTIEPSKATISLDNRGLAYGDGFFTTMGVIDGQILWLDYHHQRLVSHSKALHIELDSRSLLATLQAYAKQLQQGMLKLIVTRSMQDIRGYGYTPSASGSACDIWLKSSAMTVATAEPLCLPYGRSIPIQPSSAAICLSSQLSCLPPPLAGLKSLNRLDNVLASGELQGIKAQILKSNTERSISEGLLRDMSGQWVEGTMSNVFYQLSESPYAASKKSSTLPAHQGNANYLTTGQWYTPSMAQSGVAGVMRQVIIDTLSSTEYPVVTRSLQDEDLPKLTQIFFCNALRGIMPMRSLTLLSGEVVDFQSV
ncbi:aminotransferase class IV [Psychrobacter sp. SZ93C1]|uniref:aminotransferase class IV n=1 Tax=Psychrobacter sp. SZ93C1 TaxID=2792058 RepID=UPI0018CD9122|nr:aminotransferase class IV [Psychrobacter sp. SZ93C1]MBH0063812.1 aminotransferase class IV [Psychrobacter sp. SZ93C1]